MIFDLAGVPSFNASGHPLNTSFTFAVKSGEIITEITFSITGFNSPSVGASGGSWASEARISVLADAGGIHGSKTLL